MRTRKSNQYVDMCVHPDFRRWVKVEAARRGFRSMASFTEHWGKENLAKQDVKVNNGFKINF